MPKICTLVSRASWMALSSHFPLPKTLHSSKQFPFFVLLLSNGVTGDRSTETNDGISGCIVLLLIEKWIKLIGRFCIPFDGIFWTECWGLGASSENWFRNGRSNGRSKRNLSEIPSIIFGKVTAWYSGRWTATTQKTLVWLVFVLVPSLFCNMATTGKQLRFNLEREREILLLLRQARAKCVGVFLRGRPALDEVSRELVTVHSDLFVGLSKKSAWDLLNRTAQKERKLEQEAIDLGQTSSRTRRTQASSFQLIKANWNGNRETSCSVFHSACEKKKIGDRSSSSSRSLSSCAVRRWAVIWADPSAPGQDDGSSWTTKPSNKPAKPTNEMQNSFRRQPATRRRRPYSNPVG